MKLLAPHPSRLRQSGTAVIVVLALLTILLVYVGGNIRTLSSLDRELRLLEHQQTLRLRVTGSATNIPAALTPSQSTNRPTR